MASADRLSVALLTNAPTPYRSPFFNELSKHCRLLVSFETRREPDREWADNEQDFEFEWILTRALSIPHRRKRDGFVERRVRHIPLNVMSVLNRFRPDVVVSDELGARTASAVASCRLGKRPLIVWWAGTPHTEDGTSALTTAFRRTLLRGATRAWSYGEEAARSLVAYGVPRSRIDIGMQGMDTTRWRREVEEERAAPSCAIRERHGLRGTIILFAGSLTPRKGVRELLAAFSLLAADRELPSWSALFVGSGPRAEEIETWAHLHPSVPVALSGFVQPSELAKYHAAADLFVMPSLEDCWGLVCLEALVGGIPQVTSSLVGAAPDLVTSSEIGAVVDPRDARSLADHLAHRIRVGPQRVPEAMRANAVTTWSPIAMAKRAMSSIRLAVDGRSDGR